MALRVHQLLEQPQLQLHLLAGGSGTGQEIEWAHTCDLPDPWKWVGRRQALLTNGSALPTAPERQADWVRRLSRAGVSAIGIGAKMGAPELSRAFMSTCDKVGMPVFTIPFPLPFAAVAQAVAESAGLAQARRVNLVSRLYTLAGERVSTEGTMQGFVHSVAELISYDVAILDARCSHAWFGAGTEPGWLPGSAHASALMSNAIPAVWEDEAGDGIHVVPLAAVPGAVAFLRPRPGAESDPALILHAAAVLGAELSRAAADAVQENRRRSEYVNRILLDQNRLGIESEGWMRRLGFSGTAQGLALIGGNGDEREAVVSRLQRHGVELAVTLQHDRHLVIARHRQLESLVAHCLEGEVLAGLGAPGEPAEIHESLREALWVLLSRQEQPSSVRTFDRASGWMGFHDPHDGEEFVRRTLGPLLENSPMRQELLATLRTFLNQDRSLKRTAEQLVVHRQTVVQRLHKIEELLGLKLAATSAIAQLWVALAILDALEG